MNAEQGASGEVLVKIHKHLRYAFVLLGPDAGSTRKRIDQAQYEIERRLGRRPMLLEGECPSKPALEHLLEADALAGEHLGPGKRARKIRRSIHEALSEGDHEIDRIDRI
ncbi:hypothetical protein [Rubrobacter aplysinae]|uniref:hypothetical protein n=1 Tax=Rubrobacter aplysinae TaxID=909625 RepID=UPI00064C2C2B|nr:hypothetical protein [Rubrobacter aplysinae]